MYGSLKLSFGVCAVAALTSLPSPLNAGGLTDGRTGPSAFDGHALDHAMADLNDFLQDKYAEGEALAHLDTVPAADFVMVASAVSEAPFQHDAEVANDFGWVVSGGSSLDLHLASFNEDVIGRGPDLFIRVALAEVGKGVDFETVASDVYSGQDLTGIRNDPTLDQEMRALLEGMRAFEDRAARISQAVPSIDGTSFDRYVDTLRMF